MAGEGRRVLLVDDDAGVGRALARLFRRDGYDVRTAQDGKQGLSAARMWGPALIVTDMRMPAMSGLQMVEALRAEGSDTPVVLLSGYHDHTEDDLRALSIDLVLSKPVDPSRLRAVVAEALAQGEQPASRRSLG